MKIERQIDVNIRITNNEVAQAFFGMDDSEQAIFFNMVSELFFDNKVSMSMQMQAITDNYLLTNDGRAFMAMAGDYAAPSG